MLSKEILEAARIDYGSGVREFGTGATRDTDDNKLDPEGYLSPLVIREFSKYMEAHQHLADGTIRSSDNWQNLFGKTVAEHCAVCVKSLWRHFLDLWLFHRGYSGRENIEAALAGIIFNACAYWHALILKREGKHE